MSIPIETVEIIAITGARVAVGTGVGMALALLGSAWETVTPGMPSEVWVCLVEALTVALRVMVLVLTFPALLTVTYLHIWTPTRAGHRYSHMSAWREGTHDSRSESA